MTDAARMTISVAMASYNGGRFLAEQLASFAAQTRRPDELVVCDDGSTDSTVATIEAFAATAPFPVRLVRNAARLGYNRNFAQAIGLARHELIFISDQDDRWYPGKIAALAGVLAADPMLLSAANDQALVDGEGTPTGATVLGNVRALGYPDSAFGPGCCTAIRRDLLALAAPFPGDAVPYDHWLTMLPALLGARAVLDEPLQTYRRHDGNASASVFSGKRTGWRALVADARGTDARARLEAKRVEYATIAARLAERRDWIEARGLGDRLAPALAEVAVEEAAYRRRTAALALGRVRRAPAVARMLADGGYAGFRGWRTALKDLAT